MHTTWRDGPITATTSDVHSAPKRLKAGLFPTVAAFLIALQAALVITHIPWLDEWQALQIAVQSPDLGALLDNLHYEGHPPLWYLLLRTATSIFGAGSALVVVQLPIAIGMQSLILFRSPFERVERLLIASSFFILFDFGTLSRSLSLGVLLVIAAIAFRRTRIGWVVIALLPMADFLFGVLSLICIAIRWRERTLWFPGMLLWLMCALFAAWTVVPAPDVVPAFHPSTPIHDLGVYLVRLSVLLVPLHVADGTLQWNNPLPIALAMAAGPLFLLFGDRMCRQIPLHRLLFHAMVATTLAISVAVYPLAIRHLSLIALLLILLKWRERDIGEVPDAGFRIWLYAISACGLITAAVNLTQPFDTVYQAAAAIRKAGLIDAKWAAFPASRGQGVSAITGIEFARLPSGCTQSFMRWNLPDTIEQPADLDRALRAVAAHRGRFYLLSDLDLGKLHSDLLRQFAHIRPGYDGQSYNLYVVAPGLPERPGRLPRCLPARRPLNLGKDMR